MKPLRIYLCDLTHDTIFLVSDTIPINIGFIAAYTKKLFGDAVEISLFKYPRTAIDAIRDLPPDILGLSNYSWNSNLSERVARLAKELRPDIVTVQGGTNFPHKAPQQLDFLLRRPSTDFHTLFEGEVAFTKIVERVLARRSNGGDIFDSPVDGTVFIERSTRGSKSAALVLGSMPGRIRNLDEIPSPYLTGQLDHFFDGRLPPFIETNRGCPFQCSFCHTGADYFRKINMFSIERVREELNYIAPRAADLGITFLHIADTNFGMFPRDREICEALLDVRQRHGWPKNVVATTGKNNKERVIEITSILGDLFTVTMSVQTMDETVMKNIKRSNIKLDHYVAVNKRLLEQGRASKGEIILGLPGETRNSFIRGVEQVIEAEVSAMTIYSLMLLYGTDFKDPEYRKKFEIEGKFRIVPLNFGDYAEEKIFDYEEVGVANKDMSFDDYLFLRGFALLIETLHNGRPFEEFFFYALTLGIKRTEFIRHIQEHMHEAPKTIKRIMRDFIRETRDELWDSEEDLVAHYQKDENYRHLVRGEAGGNLIYKYKSQSIVFAVGEWVYFLAQQLENFVDGQVSGARERALARREIETLAEFCRKKVAGLLDATADLAPISMESRYDIVGWLQQATPVPFSRYARRQPITYVFEFTDEQLKIRRDQFDRYGTDINALSKIVTRISTLESLFRRVRTSDGHQTIRREAKGDDLTRYGLSN